MSGLGKTPSRSQPQDLSEQGEGFDDVLYLPPVDGEFVAARNALATAMAGAGTPVLVQLFPDQGVPEGTLGVYDILRLLLEQRVDAISALTLEGGVAVWPLIAGYTDDEAFCRAGIDYLRRAGVEVIQGLEMHLSPADRRSIVDLAGDDGFEALFHGPAPDGRAFSSWVAEAGVQPFVRRPLPTGSRSKRDNREIAGLLMRVADLWIRLERAEGRGQSIYASARRIDSEHHDFRGIGRDGNLGIVDWLDPISKGVIEEWASAGTTSLLDDLQAAYLK